MNRRSKILVGVVRSPGASMEDIGDFVGETLVSSETRRALGEMEAVGELVSSKSVTSHSRFGLPIRSTLYYPTALATEWVTFHFIAGHPGCYEDSLNAFLAPDGGIPNWVETDIESLVSQGYVEVREISVQIPGTNAIRAVRTFWPTKLGKANASGEAVE